MILRTIMNNIAHLGQIFTKTKKKEIVSTSNASDSPIESGLVYP